MRRVAQRIRPKTARPTYSSLILLLFLFGTSSAAAQESTGDVEPKSPTDSLKKTGETPTADIDSSTLTKPAQGKLAAAVEKKPVASHALIICGHPGTSDHLQKFAASIAKMRQGLIANYGTNADNISVLFGEGPDGFADAEKNAAADEANDSDSANMFPAWLKKAPAASRENIQQAVESLEQTINPQDSLWVISVGHSYLNKGRSWFNLPGPDLQQTQFARLFENVRAQRQVFFVTTPASGFYVKALSRPGRVIISATEAAREINETFFPHALADIIVQQPAELEDADEDGVVSLFDLYIATVRNVADQYIDTTTIPTEHAQLDDNGDKRMTELQRHYLDEDRGGLPPRRQTKTLRNGADGIVSRGIELATNSKPANAKQPAATEDEAGI